MASTSTYFGPRIFEFLKDLAAHNDRDWFNANQARYEEEVKLPLLRFIADFAPKLEKISPEFMADPRPQGGSMFRIYRDTRFSRDKSPFLALHPRLPPQDGLSVHQATLCRPQSQPGQALHPMRRTPP